MEHTLREILETLKSIEKKLDQMPVYTQPHLPSTPQYPILTYPTWGYPTVTC